MYYVYDNKDTPGHRDTGTPGHRDTGTPDARLRVLSSWAAEGKENKRDISTFVSN